ncbi:hypothetical protein KIF59_04880 [Enterobacter cloacae subsp. cloacae]|nr:hypothetical protein [Enterobacter cloacae subsp. cloacae]
MLNANVQNPLTLFFIAESGDLFCVDRRCNSAFVNYIIERYRHNVALFGKPSPTRIRLFRHGSIWAGYWKTVDNDYHGTKNVLIMAINRLTEYGGMRASFGSDGKDYMNTSRDKIQHWTPLPDDLDNVSRALISEKSVIRRYGEARSIYQSIRKGMMHGAVSGKSWQWIPGVREERL